jgi:RNA polymerase sigma-70 factor (ECF subfamily)
MGPHRGGDDPDLEDFFRAHGAELVRRARKILGPDAADAEDVVNDVLLKLVVEFELLNARVESMPAYVRKMVTNKALDYRNHANSTRILSYDPDAGDNSAPDPAAELVADSAVAWAMGQLTRQQRAVLMYTVDEGMTPAEIAAELGICAGTVRDHLASARRRLHQLLRDTGDSHER